MKKILIVLLIINNIIIQYDSIIKSKEDLYEIKHINMEDKEGKISFIKNKVQTGEKYNFENGKTFLQYVIIGEWIIPPNKCINFYKNNIYKIRDFSTNFQEKGHWKLEGNKLMLSKNSKNSSNWRNYIIDYFIFEYSNFSSIKYSFTIVLKDNYEIPILVILFD